MIARAMSTFTHGLFLLCSSDMEASKLAAGSRVGKSLSVYCLFNDQS